MKTIKGATRTEISDQKISIFIKMSCLKLYTPNSATQTHTDDEHQNEHKMLY